ncbi:MAG: RHS repeat-associated core domain-containing protein [Chlamydiia bacterium]
MVKKQTPFTSTQIEYNNSSLPESIHNYLPNQTRDESLNWERSGKLASHTTLQKQQTFTYSPRGHLSSAGKENYTFDPNGVRTAPAETPTIYDFMGQTVAQNDTTFTWDPWGRLLKVTTPQSTWEASYDGLGRRLQTRWNGVITTSLYDPETEFREIGHTIGKKTYWKYYGPTSVDAITDETGATAILSHNGLHQLDAVITAASTTYIKDLPTAYGQTPRQPRPTSLLTYAQSLLWHSLDADPTGLIWMGARYYDPAQGRFLSPDPISHPACLDLYTYANSDPVNLYDPDGRCASAVYQATINSPRFWGLAQAFGGAVETKAGVVVTPICPPLGAIMIGHGVDNVYTGLRSAYTNNYQETLTTQVLTEAGVSPGTIAATEFLLNAAPGGVKNLRTPFTQAPSYIKNIFSTSKQTARTYTDLTTTSGWSQSVMNARMANIFKSEVSSTALTKYRYRQPEVQTYGKLVQLEQRISDWLGEGTLLIYNNAREPIFMSQDGLRKARFDFIRPFPHNNPHMHLETFNGRKWIGPHIYPSDVPHN